MNIEATKERLETKGREIVQVGWDGRSQPIYRYRDELHLNEWMQARVYPPTIDAPYITRINTQ